MKNNISMRDFYEKYNNNSSEKLTILDVREIHEYTDGHIPSAENFPLSTLGEDFSKLDKDQKYYVICQAGGRSAKAYDFLDAQGFDVINIEGGMNNWPGETK
ncbi:rhodanese-like domain-containing protein [Gemella haemolysans]|uniref:rhodanese-like domain-containing protein n=1 Tax=Gemella haemolysans TaxID=1379 RepID=UPI0023798428|nr:rhodanese-like domain-containing protein [Gemella haemolysans]